MSTPKISRRTLPYFYLGFGLLLVTIGLIVNDRVWTGMAWFGAAWVVGSLLWLAIRHGL